MNNEDDDDDNDINIKIPAYLEKYYTPDELSALEEDIELKKEFNDIYGNLIKNIHIPSNNDNANFGKVVRSDYRCIKVSLHNIIKNTANNRTATTI